MVGSSSNLTGRVGLGQEAFESSQVGSSRVILGDPIRPDPRVLTRLVNSLGRNENGGSRRTNNFMVWVGIQRNKKKLKNNDTGVYQGMVYQFTRPPSKKKKILANFFVANILFRRCHPVQEFPPDKRFLAGRSLGHPSCDPPKHITALIALRASNR